MNDATGLVGFKFALAAVVAGSFSLSQIALQFSLLALGGFATGLVIGYGIGRLRDLLQRLRTADALIEITLSLMTPYAAYLAAEHLGVSGILAVVAAGLYSGWRDPVRMDVETRQTAFAVWGLVLFWLNGIAFVLLGLQFPGLLAAVRDHYSIAQLLGFTAAVAGAAMVARFVWVYSGIYLPSVSPGVCADQARRASALVIGWADRKSVV